MTTTTHPSPQVRRGTPAPGTQHHGVLRIIGTTLTWAFASFNVLVLLFMLFSSFKTTKEIFRAPWAPPSSLHFENWSQAWSNGGFGSAAVNTILVVAASSVSVLVIAAPAAYALSRTQTRLAGGLTVFFTLGIGIPTQVTIIPIFVMMAKVNLVNNLFGLYVVYTAVSLPFTVFLLTGFFRSLPGRLEEAAAIDGAGVVRTFVQIMLPLARSGLVTALILNIIGLWHETLIALVFIQDQDKSTLSLSLLSFMSTITSFSDNPNWGALFAGVSILVLPMLALYVWLGRRIVEGITVGATK
ncbi:carbohydrate ABC transporter permease [Nocardioides sp. YIM 152315]|uniref:carbohydrate ABC transporter permease n=1 Tax=Nocardioides sp. YIM 152315 TaxID=3031760 RepID=UPI0023DC872A|nr:carbohydrate ABC transporter permease [Nocardioides sp. YIM 152315]MDF1602618.1 carbohydrate ABC transporter permease [Nocardioides sp. YIM 152315]